jgi:hypothetical protein
MKVNPSKCECEIIVAKLDGKGEIEDLELVFKINGESIPNIEREGSYKYLEYIQNMT